jgi:O-Antigen ligase
LTHLRTLEPSNVLVAPRVLAAKSRTLTKDDRHARTLTSLVFASSTVPGAIEYLGRSHQSLLASVTAVRTPLASDVSLLINVLIVLFAFYVAVSRGLSISRNAADLVLVLTIFAWSLLGLWREGDVTTRSILDYLTVGLIVIALWCLRPSRALYAHVGRLISILVIYSLIFALADPAGAYYTSLSGAIGESTKSFIGHNQLASVFGHSNTLGIVIALGIPFILLLERRVVRLVVLALAIWVLVWSSSRTGVFAAGFAFVLVSILRQVPRRLAGPVVWVSSLIVLAVVFLLPLRTTDPNAFTRRGAIWIGSLAEAHHNVLFGQGPNWYSDIAQFDNDLGNQASSGHNWFVSTLALGGLVGLVLGAILIFRLLVLASRQLRGTGASVTVYRYWISVIALSTLEYIWVTSPRADLFFSVTFLMILLLRVEGLENLRNAEDQETPPRGSIPPTTRLRGDGTSASGRSLTRSSGA